MAKFMFLYNGPATPMEDIDPAKGAEIMAAWGKWIESCGSALINVGSPLGNSRSVVDDGSEGKASALNGYSVVECDTIEDALKLCNDHPFLSDKTGKFSVEVHEILPMPM